MESVSTAGDALSEILAVVAHSHAPVVVLTVPDQVITAASPGAHELLGCIAHPLIGRRLDDFADGAPTGAMPLLASGRITGYETVRALRSTGERRRVWVRAVDDARPVQLALAVLLKEDTAGRPFVPWQDDDGRAPVIGSTDARLLIERLSNEIHQTFGHHAHDLIGTSLLTLVAPGSLPAVLNALSETSQHAEGLTLLIDVVRADHEIVAGHLVLLPLTPAPSCAFALLAEDSSGAAPDARASLITKLSHGIRGAVTSQYLAAAELRADVDTAQLSSRELEIVSLLMTGDRVSAIAEKLFLSEGTVRNNLSTIFGKLGVGNQQELITLLRPAATSQARVQPRR